MCVDKCLCMYGIHVYAHTCGGMRLWSGIFLRHSLNCALSRVISKPQGQSLCSEHAPGIPSFCLLMSCNCMWTSTYAWIFTCVLETHTLVLILLGQCFSHCYISTVNPSLWYFILLLFFFGMPPPLKYFEVTLIFILNSFSHCFLKFIWRQYLENSLKFCIYTGIAVTDTNKLSILKTYNLLKDTEVLATKYQANKRHR